MLKQLVCVLLIAQSAAAWRRPFPKPRAARNHPQENDAWSAVREQLAGWPLTDNFAVQVGNASGTVFKFTKGNFSLHQRVETASTSKWPMAMGLLGLVADGTVPSLDAKVASYVDWWKPTNASDPRGNITMRHLLSFTSGFGEGSPGDENSTATCMDNATYAPGFLSCAQNVYRTIKLTGPPGHTFTYNSVHLQLAGAVAVTLTGLDIQAVVEKYLLKPYGMVNTTCYLGAPNPQLAVCLETTGADYGRFLQRTLSHSVLPAALVRESEKDHTPFMSHYPSLYGNYGFGHFLECFDSVVGMTPACRAAKVHCDPGAFGFYPLIDRRNGYYFELVAYENGKVGYPRSGIPEYLRLLAKPLVDATMRGEAGREWTFGHHTEEYNALSLVDVNYITNCYIHPEECE